MNIAERIERIVREWPQWSKRERERIDAIVEEIMAHCRGGCGNAFVRKWCDLNLKGVFE